MHYVPYVPSYVVGELETGGKIKRKLPDVVVRGGITEFDKDLLRKNNSIGVRVNTGGIDDFVADYDSNGSVSYRTNSDISRMVFDIYMSRYESQVAISRTYISNSIFIKKDSKSYSIGAYFEGCGLNFNYSINRSQGVYKSIRLLVQFSVLQMLGKYYQIPYWRCIEGAQPDQSVINSVKEDFEELDNIKKVKFIKYYAKLHKEKMNMKDFEKDLKSAQEGKKLCNLFIELWSNIPYENIA